VAPEEVTNLEAAQSGSQLSALIALRDTLAAQLDTTDAQIHAQLAAQYRQTLSDIAEIAPDEDVTDAESIADAVALRLA
jgi:hypothetical protein